MTGNQSVSTKVYLWTRNLHLYFGLFICPYVLVFAVTTIMLNHRWDPEVQVEKTTTPVQLEEGLEDFEQGGRILRQLGLSGEVHVDRLPKENRLRIGVAKPGTNTIVTVDLATRIAEVERRNQGFSGAIRFLHLNPGPHKIKGVNWFFSKLWAWTTDAVVYLFLFITVSGIYLWILIKAERKIGLLMLGAGCLSFFLILAGLLS